MKKAISSHALGARIMYHKHGNESIWVMVGILAVSACLTFEYLYCIVQFLG
jgi:hypothetical protein